MLYRIMPRLKNILVASFSTVFYHARVLHYPDSMWHSFCPEFVQSLRTTHQLVANWLDSLGSMKNEAPVHWRITSQLLKKFRTRQESAYKE